MTSRRVRRGARLTGANQLGGTQVLQGTSQAAAYLSGIALLAQEEAQQEWGRSLTPEEFTAMIDREAPIWSALIKQIGLTAE